MTRGTGTTPRFSSHAPRPCMHSHDVEECWWKAAAAAVASCVRCDPARDHACDSMDSRIRGVARSRRTQQTKQRRAHERMLLDRELALSLRGERCVMHDAVACRCMVESECTAQQAGSCARIRGMRLRGSLMCPIWSWTGARITREWSRASDSSKSRALREERRVAVSRVGSLCSFTLHVGVSGTLGGASSFSVSCVRKPSLFKLRDLRRLDRRKFCFETRKLLHARRRWKLSALHAHDYLAARMVARETFHLPPEGSSN